MISAKMQTAISSGVLAPISMPIGVRIRAIKSSLKPASFRSRDPLPMRTAAAQYADIRDVGRQRRDQRLVIDLRVVRQHREVGAAVQAQLRQAPCPDSCAGYSPPRESALQRRRPPADPQSRRGSRPPSPSPASGIDTCTPPMRIRCGPLHLPVHHDARLAHGVVMPLLLLCRRQACIQRGE